MVYCVGLTGNLASGKSTVTALFAEFGATIIDADQISRSVTAKNKPALTKIVTHFGSDVLDSNGELNRRKLRNLIFSNDEERIWLEELLHPLIRREIKAQISKCATPYCIIEIPLLRDKELYPYLNSVLVVNAPEQLLISRVIVRDQCTHVHAKAILSSQPDAQSLLSIADDVILNTQGIAELKTRVEELHHYYLQQAQELADK